MAKVRVIMTVELNEVFEMNADSDMTLSDNLRDEISCIDGVEILNYDGGDI